LRVEYATFRIFTSTGDATQDALVFGQNEAYVPQLDHAPLTLTIPGSIALDAHWTIYAHTTHPNDLDSLSQAHTHEQQSWRWWVVLDNTRLGYEHELRIRTRQPGDRFRPAGGRGSCLVKKILVDRKVPRGLRDRLPIVTTPSGDIVWVAGLRADARFVIKDEDKVSERVWLVIKQTKKIML
jgi:tRNA(Ile)-lysidine synthetase-like protein